MSKQSRVVKSLLKRAAADESFAQTLLTAPDAALSQYELDDEESAYIKSLTTRADLQQAHEHANAPVSPADDNLSTIFWLVALYLGGVASVLYLLANLYARELLSFFRLPFWTELGREALLILIVYSALTILATGYLALRRAAGWSTPTRVAALLAAVIFVVTPSSVWVASLPPSAQQTFTRVVLTLIFTVLPASFYWLFMTTRGKTLWEEFQNNLGRLDPVTYPNIIRIYRKKFEALYGPIDQSGFGSALLQGEASFPVLFATMLIGIGWIWFYPSFGTDAASQVVPGFVGLVTPFTFGFLGAYLFSLQMLFRRYVQSDLKSVAYTHVSQRILVTWMWVYALDAIPWEVLLQNQAASELRRPLVSVLAFAVGIFPDIAWQAVRQFIQRVLALALPSFREAHPLSQIEGITLWTEARLLEEDIENVQNLVTTNIADLMLRTNLKPQRIIDWIDQGILRLHLTNDKKDPLVSALRARGIVTATDLIMGYRAHRARAQHAGDGAQTFISKELDPQAASLAMAIEDDPNMYHVKAWLGIRSQLIAKLPAAIDDQIEREVSASLYTPAELEPERLLTAPAVSDGAARAVLIGRAPPSHGEQPSG